MSSAINEQGNSAGGAWGRVSQADGPADQRHGCSAPGHLWLGGVAGGWQRVRLDPQVVEDACEEVRILLCPVGICSRLRPEMTSVFFSSMVWLYSRLFNTTVSKSSNICLAAR